jgi:hypothetical protein
MRSNVLLFLLIYFIFYSLGFSQIAEGKVNGSKTNIFFKGGLNLATLVGKYTDDYDLNKGIIFGFSRSGKINKFFNYQVDLLYSMKGTSYVYKNEFDENEFINLELHYIELPLIIKRRLREENPEKNTFIIFLNFGCTIGLNTKAEIVNTDQNLFIDISKEIKKQELGIVIGTSIEKKLKNQKVASFEFRYNRSVINIWENDDFENYNEVFSFIFGFSFLELK